MRRTATGSWWLDKLTAPYWTLRAEYAEWKLFLDIGGGDYLRGKRIFRQALAESLVDDLIARCREEVEL